MPGEFDLLIANLTVLGYTDDGFLWTGGSFLKVLVINGSPKGLRSNTYRLTSAFLDGIKDVQNAELREFHVSKLDIKSCLGCFSCWNKTPGQCCISDDMAQVLDAQLWADVIVWSFPLYYFSVPGGLKNLIDRQLPLSLPFMSSECENGGHPSRYDMSGKRHVVISTCGFHTAKGNYDGVLSLFEHMCGKGESTTIFCGQGELFRVKELSAQTDAYLQTVRRAGAEFCCDGISVQTQMALETPLFPRDVFEKMADASWGLDSDTGEKSDDTLVFTKQMAALYNPKSFDGKQKILEMYYTDMDKRYQILLDGQGSRVITSEFSEPTTRIETPYSVWKAIASGEISGAEALSMGQYRVKGDFSLMLNWDKYFGSRQEVQTPNKSECTNMTILLLPWIVFWAAVSSHGFFGALICIAVCALIPLIFYKNRKTVYDILSGVLVTGLGIAVLLGAPVRWILPVSYFLFGGMWCMSCLFKIPLTAHYSMNDYNGEEALRNPIFMKTNRILTLMWGVLYLLIGVGCLVTTGFAVVSYIAPALMGIFTVWFQRWYPAKVARGN